MTPTDDMIGCTSDNYYYCGDIIDIWVGVYYSSNISACSDAASGGTTEAQKTAEFAEYCCSGGAGACGIYGGVSAAISTRPGLLTACTFAAAASIFALLF